MSIPYVLQLESRRLLSAQISSIAYNGTDLTGPTAAPGPDGTQDLHFELTDLPRSAPIDYITIASQSDPSHFTWTYGSTSSNSSPNAGAGPSVQVLLTQDSGSETADVYFSPIVQYISPDTGQISDWTLPTSNTLLTVTVGYWGQSVPFRNISPPTTDPAADPPPALPTLDYATYPATFEPQSTTTGLASIQLTGLPLSSTIDPTSVILSDAAGLEWGDESLDEPLRPESYGRPELGLSISYSTDPVINPAMEAATISFPPYRDEAGTTMALTYRLTGNSTEYVTDVLVPSGDHTDPRLLNVSGTSFAYPAPYGNANPYSAPLVLSPVGPNSPDMVTYPGSGPVDLETLINQDAQNGICNNFELTTGTYYLDKVLLIQAPMTIQGAAGSKAALEFTFKSTSLVSDQDTFYTLQGAINLRSSHVWLENLGVGFQQTDVNLGQFVDPHSGAVVDDGQGAIIDAHGANQFQNALVDLNIVGLTIDAAFDHNDINSNDTNALDEVGYQADSVIHMGDYDSGTIEGNTFYGGTAEVQFGPWMISGNQCIGSVAGTISESAFAVGGHAHDVTIQGNTLTDPDYSRDGQLDRLVTFNDEGYDINIVGNSVSDHVGDLVLNGNATNNSEMILPEGFGTLFEGNTLATSISTSSLSPYDRTLIAIPSSELMGGVGPVTGGALTTPVLFIHDGPNAGTAIAVTQEFVFGNSTCFVLASPLPQGDFDFSINPTYNGFTVSGNRIDTSGTVSYALVLPDNLNNVQVTGNTFIGDQTTVWNGWSSGAIRISDWQASAMSSSYGGDNGYYASLTSMFGITISGNTIINSIGGIAIYVAMGPKLPTTYGRTYTFVAIDDNTFSYNYQPQAGVIHMGDGSLTASPMFNQSTYSMFVPGTTTVVPDPTATYFVDPRDISVNASGNILQWVGLSPSPPATDVEINATEVNGRLYDGEAYAPSSLPAIAALMAPQAPAEDLVAIACGSTTTGIGSFGADAYFSGGTTYTSQDPIDTTGVNDAPPEQVFQSQRYGNSTYTIPGLTAGAAYIVRMDFAETIWNAPGQRLFNVFINGVQVLTSFDIYAVAGAKDKAIAETFVATANGQGQISIAFSNIANQDNAMVDGIEITPQASIAIACGSPSAVGPFQVDGDFSAGINYTDPNPDVIDTSGVSNPAPQQVYLSQRFGNFTYTIPNLVPNASYVVRLDFAETFWSQAGQRLFNVSINNVPVLTNFDVLAVAGGKDKAIAESFVTVANASGQIAIQFTNTPHDNAIVSGIEISPQGSIAFAAGSGSAVGSYAEEAGFSGGSPWNPPAHTIDTSGVTNPAPQAVYQAERYGNTFSYTVPGLVPGADYNVRLDFAELAYNAAGSRRFNVSINGVPVLTNFDIYGVAGGEFKAIAESFLAVADGSGDLTIQFTNLVGGAKVDGISITPATGVAIDAGGAATGSFVADEYWFIRKKRARGLKNVDMLTPLGVVSIFSKPGGQHVHQLVVPCLRHPRL